MLLHVGSTIPRKRIDVLLRMFGELCASHSGSASRSRRRTASRSTSAARACSSASRIGIAVLDFLDDRDAGGHVSARRARPAAVGPRRIRPAARRSDGVRHAGRRQRLAVLQRSRRIRRRVLRARRRGAVVRAGGGTARRTAAVAGPLAGASRAGVARAGRFSWSQFAARLAAVYHEVAAHADPVIARGLVSVRMNSRQEPEPPRAQ